MPYLVADSALYSEENLQRLDGVKWLTRVPERIGLAQTLLAAVGPAVRVNLTNLQATCSKHGLLRAALLAMRLTAAVSNPPYRPPACPLYSISPSSLHPGAARRRPPQKAGGPQRVRCDQEGACAHRNDQLIPMGCRAAGASTADNPAVKTAGLIVATPHSV